VWEEALRRFARLQVAHAGQADQLREWGCVDRRLAGLPEQLELLLEEIAAPEHRTVYGLTAEDAARAAALAPRLRELVARLAAAGVPETLVHGDLHGGNVRVEGDRIVFFDWTDGALAHPFFDLLTLFRHPRTDLKTPGTRERLRDIYLEAWAEFLPRERLLAAFALSQQVAPLYHALSYRAIALTTEPSLQWELSDGVGDYLGLLLAASAETSKI
jgi:aminoglycoside phosphotransferase (APT) family kinase protein